MSDPLLWDTIVAVATPPGGSSQAILRLSGPAALEISSHFLRLPEGTLADARPFTVLPARLRLRILEMPASVVVFRSPRSSTGEDLVEITLPGAPPLLASVLSAFLAPREGPELRLARPGEFTLRGFRRGRMDLSQAEAVGALIRANSDAEERAAARQLQGELRSRVEEVSSGLLQALALLEAALDFPDEDLPEIAPPAVGGRIEAGIAALDLLSRSSALRLPDRGALRVALAGFPNAGKSSLLNRLLGRPAAIVGELEGTTRDPVRGSQAASGGRAIEWVDLAGFEAPPPSLEEADPLPEELAVAVARLTRRELEGADIMVWVVDGASPGAERSLELFRALPAARKLLVVQKSDLLDSRAIAGWLSRPERPLVVSALTGRGVEDLRARVAEGEGLPETAQFLLTARQEAALAVARESAARALETLRSGGGYELAAVDLRESLGSLDGLTGRETGERVLEEIFGRFCIGK